MKAFLSFVRKEFYHIFRDGRTMLILLAMPVIQIILFGFALTTEVKNVQVAVLDGSRDVSTREIIRQLEASEYFDVKSIHRPDDIDRLFRQGRANLVLVFGAHFHENLLRTGEASLQLIVDASEPNQAATWVNYASRIFESRQQAMSRGGSAADFRIRPEIRMLYNPEMKSAYNFVPGVMGLILMLICAMMTSIAIVREKEMGTMEVLLVSPIRPLYIIVAKMVPYFTLSMVNLTTILLLSVFVLRVPVAGNLWLLLLLSLLFVVVALALGLLISNVVKTQVAAVLVSGMGLMMPTMILSGMIFPIENMPAALQGLSALLPARWYIAAVRKLMVQGVGGLFVLREFAALALMAVVLLAVSLKKFKIRLS
jgi:ABC-2 type transport system permease protein